MPVHVVSASDVHLLNLDHELFDLFQQRSDAGY
jgi:hypothetical protein